MALRRKRPGRPRLSCFDRLLWVYLYSYVRGNGYYPKRSQRFAWLPNSIARMLDTIFSRWPATRHVQFALAGALFCLGLGANGTTILSVATGLIAGFAFGRGSTIAGVLLLGTSALLDAVDGTIAREFAAATPLGGILDLCSDRVVEIAVIIGISWRRPELYFPALILTGSWYLNITVFLAAGAALESRGPKLIDYPPGLVERTELIIFFGVLALLLQFGPWLCYAYTGLELITAAQRLLFARRMLSGKPKP